MGSWVQAGTGTVKYASGGVYEGGWEYNEKHGSGTYKDADGNTYDGDWEGGGRHGQGTHTFAEGEVYKGGWVDGNMHGFGTYTYPDGTVLEGWWKDGEHIWPTPPKEEIGDALASVLLKDEATVDGIDALIFRKSISYLADLLHESNLAQRMAHSMEDILRPWLNGLGFDANDAKECSDAVMQCAERASTSGGANDPPWALGDENDVMFVTVVDGSDNTKGRYSLLSSTPLELFLKNYASCKNISVRRFEHDGRTRFLSDISRKTPMDLGLKEGDEIKVVAVSTDAATTKEEDVKPKQQTPNSKKKKKHRHRKKSNKKKSMPIVPPESDEAKWKEQHSQALSSVFEEADLQFGEIRQRLAAMNLQRTMPKQRKSQPKEETAAAETVVANPPADGLGGKAGKVFFVVQVGEATNLYNTRAKPSNGGGKQSPPGRIAREIDLHGCTKEEALAKLDECLPEWMDAAMKGEYPWVITARIVCGGGTQTLAEAVEGWIKRKPNVSNAPKNLYS